MSPIMSYFHFPLFRMWLIGLAICGSALLGAISTSDYGATGPHCENQEQHRKQNIERANTKLQKATARLAILNKALTDESHRAFVSARDEMGAEKTIINQLQAQINGLEIPKVMQELRWIVPALFLPFFLTAIVTLFMLKDFRWVINDRHNTLTHWVWPYIATVGILTFASTTEAFLTSYLTVQSKGWFGWDSYCVAPRSFWLMRVQVDRATGRIARVRN